MDQTTIGEYIFKQLMIQGQLPGKQDFVLKPLSTISEKSPRMTVKIEKTDGNAEHHHQTKGPEILFVFSGKMVVKTAGKEFPIGAGNFIFFDEETKYTLLPLHWGDVLVRINMDSSFELKDFLENIYNTRSSVSGMINKINHAYRKDHYAVFNAPKVDNSSYVIDRVLIEYVEPGLLYCDKISHLLAVLVLVLLENDCYVDPGAVNLQSKYQISDFTDYITKNFQNITLTSMARFFGYNPSYLSTELKQTTGYSYKELVENERMKQAVELLKNPAYTINEVVNYVGYTSKSFFYKKFKAHYEMSPAKMREQLSER